MTEPAPERPPLEVGRVVVATRHDPATGRQQCSACNRTLITGQQRCLCGAQFA